VVNFTLRPLYPRGKSPRYPLERRLGGPESWSGRFEEEDRVLLGRSDEQPPVDFKLVTMNTAITTLATVARVTKMRRFNLTVEHHSGLIIIIHKNNVGHLKHLLTRKLYIHQFKHDRNHTYFRLWV
jgi:hypothetical protein